MNVPYDGPKTCEIYLVGEAPGDHEVKTGKPFVGPAGKLLTTFLSSVGIVRPTVRIANVIPVNPKDNMHEWIILGATKPALNKARKIMPEFIDDEDVLYTPRFAEAMKTLHEDILECNPKVIIALGNIALYALTGQTQISKRRGSVYTFHGIPVVPTYHPSSCFASYTNRYLIMTDLLKAQEIVKNGYKPPERHLLIAPSFADTMSFLSACEKCTMVAFDIETIRTKKVGKVQEWEISCLSLAISSWEAICIPLLDENRNNYFSEEQELEIWVKLQRILLNPAITKLGQNLMFDLTFIKRKMDITLWPIHDTMILQALANPDFPKDLGFLCSLYSDEPYYKDESKLHKTYGGSTVERFWIYSAKDSAVLFDIFPKLYKEVEELGEIPIYEMLCKMVRVLADMQYRGIRVDIDNLEIASEAAGRQIEELSIELKRLCGEDLNPASTQQMKTYFYGKKKIKPFLKDGRPTLDEDALIRLAARDIPEAEILLQIRKLSKLKGTYMDVTMDLDGRLRSSYNPVGTVTLRLASSATIFGTGTNVQTFPSSMKPFLLPDPNHLIYEIDLSQAENRIVAYIAPERKMIEAFESNLDVHSLTASLISGIPYDEVRDQHKADIKCNLAKGDKTWRQWGKSANHALNYGLGAQRLALKYEMPLADANFLREKYHQAYPGVRQYHSWVSSMVKKERRLTNCMGHTRLFLDRLDNMEKAYAFIPQSTVAIKINMHGLIPIYYNLPEVVIVNQVHDSIVLEIPVPLGPERHWELLSKVKFYLEQPITWRGFTFSIPAEVKGGTNLGNLKDIRTLDDVKALFGRGADEEEGRGLADGLPGVGGQQ